MLDLEFLIEIMPFMMSGLLVTLEATLGGFAIALVVGLVLALGGRSPFRPVRAASAGYIAVIRCTPLLVQLYFVFYVLPAFGIRFGALTTGILCLGLHIGAYVAEAYRAGIDAVPEGQWEAARSLGLAPLPVWFRVILPQALPPMVPPLGNFLIGLFKETPLLAAITVIDVFGAANNIAGQTYRFTEPYTAAALILLTVSLVAAAVVRKIELRVNSPKDRTSATVRK